MSDTKAPKPAATRDQILDVAQEAILAKGFGATSIEELIAAVGISKSGFFYHFRDKGELAKALLHRYIAEDDEIFDQIFARADQLSEDPLHSFLIALKILAETFSDLPNGHPGCIVASVCYHERLFSNEVLEINKRAVLGWRRRFKARLERIARIYPSRIDVDLDSLADMFSGVTDGGIILTRTLKDAGALPKQIMLYRDFVRLMFSAPDGAPAPK